MKFFVLGSINYDIILRIERFPREHEKLRSLGRVESCGGAAANTAYWLARLGLPVRMLGAVGDDMYASRCVKDLENAGVDCAGVQRIAHAQTGMNIVFVNETSKSMLGSGNAARFFDPDAVCDISFTGKDFFHVTMKTVPEIQDRLKEIKTSGCVVSCEFNGGDFFSHLPWIDYAFMNEDELTSISPENDPLSWAEARARECGSRVVITRRHKGAVLLGGPVRIEEPASVVKPKDRTGGGDAFDAGFLYGLAKGEPYDRCLRLGLKLAKAVISRHGTRPSMDIGQVRAAAL